MSDGKLVLIKSGGNVLSDAGGMAAFASDVKRLIGAGYSVAVVHGGGPEISREMEARGLAVRKVAGLRVTDQAAFGVAAEVLGGVNRQLVAALRGEGIEAIGLSGGQAGLLASKKPPVKAEDGSLVDLGRVGDVSRADRARMDEFLRFGAVPVVHPICHGGDGPLNVNADSVASALAAAVGADMLVLVTDVPGVLRGGASGKEVIPALTAAEAQGLIADGTVSGGMIPKVQACLDALSDGVPSVLMVNGKEPGTISRRLLNGEKLGTEITRS